MEPKIPTLKDSKKPQVKVRGLEAGVTLFDRLKQFKKKDLAFILAGLGTLFMAPLAEHFMMAPEGGDAALNAGFGGKGGKGGGLFDSGGNGSVGYDVSNGQAPGSAVGGGSDVITPLNVRDPSALVMGPGATQQPPTNSVAPATPPPTAPVTRSDSDLKDALAASARGVGGAAKAAKAMLPVPKIALAGAGGLRGLGVANGGSSASSSLGPISSSGLTSGKANTGGGMAGVKGGSNIKGVARGQSQGGGGLEALKAAANNAGDQMNRGPAQAALDQTAAQAIPNGGGSFGGSGQGGAGANDKAESGNGGKDNKSTGESLEFLKQKAMQEKKIELWAKEQEAGDNKLELLKLRNSMAEAIAGKVGGAIGDAITCPMTKGFKKCYAPASDPGTWVCDFPGGGHASPIDGGDVGSSCDGNAKYTTCGARQLCQCTGTGGDKGTSNESGTPTRVNCDKFGGDGSSGGAAAGSKQSGGAGSVGGNPGGIANDILINNIGSVCSKIDTYKKPADIKGVKVEPNADLIAYLDVLKKSARQIVVARDAAYRGPSADCQAGTGVESLKPKTGDATVAADEVKTAVTTLVGAGGPDGKLTPESALGQIKAVVAKDDGALEKVPGVEDYKKAVANWTAANDLVGQAKDQVVAAVATMKAGKMPAATGDATLTNKLTELKDSIISVQKGVKAKIETVDTAVANLKTSLDDAGRVIGQVPMDGSKGAPIQNVVANNVEYKRQMGDAKDGFKGGTLDATLQKVNAHNEANGGKPISYKAPEPSKDAPDVSKATGATTVKAIDDTKKSLETLKTQLSTVDSAIPKQKGPFVDSEDPIKSAGAAADDATTNKASMQQNQTNWLTNIQTHLPNPSTLPAKAE